VRAASARPGAADLPVCGLPAPALARGGRRPAPRV